MHITELELQPLLKFEGVPRHEMEIRIQTLARDVQRLRDENRVINANITVVQSRCTEQEEELRLHRRESRLTGTTEGKFFLDAAHANELGKKKYFGSYTLDHMLNVLCEETGEAARAHCHNEGRDALYAELAQVAGVCARIAAEQLASGD